MPSVWAYRNRGEWYFVANSKQECHQLVGQQVGGDQCEVCGSVGWTVRGTLTGPLRVVCGPDDHMPGCGTAKVLSIQDEDEVIF